MRRSVHIVGFVVMQCRSPSTSTHVALFLALLVPLAACGPTSMADGSSTEIPRPLGCDTSGCFANRDCGASAMCQDENPDDEEPGCCIMLYCATDDECDVGERCATSLALCVVDDPCTVGTSDGCLDGQVCLTRDGRPACVDDEALTPATSCHVEPAHAIVTSGDVVRFSVVARDERGAPLFTHEATFSSTLGATTVSGRSGELKADQCASLPCQGEVAIETGGASCAASVVVLAPPADDELRVSVQDVRSHAPLAAVRVVARVDGVLREGATDVAGIAVFTDVALDTVSAVSVFAAGYDHLTVASPPTRDLALFVDESQPVATVRAVKGLIDFAHAPEVGDFRWGYVGAAPRAPLVDVDFTTLFGPLVPVSFYLEGVTSPDDVAFFPSGQVLHLGNSELKADFVAPLGAHESTLFSFAGRPRLADVGSIFSALAVSESDEISRWFTDRYVTNVMARFAHGTVHGVVPASAPVPVFDEERLFDSALFDVPAVDVTPSVAAELPLVVDVPRLPCSALSPSCVSGPYVPGALVMTGVRAPGQGYVPLAIHAALDVLDFDLADGLVGESVGSRGRVAVQMVPPHQGLEGFARTTIVVASESGVLFPMDDGALPTAAARAVSALVTTSDDVSESVGFSSEGFLPLPSATRVDDDTIVVENVAGRVSLVRVRQTDASGAAWDIVAPSSALPALSTLRPADVVGRSDAATITLVRLGGVPGASSYADVVGRQGRALSRLDEATDAFARVDVE